MNLQLAKRVREELRRCFQRNKILLVTSIEIFLIGFVLGFVLLYSINLPDLAEYEEEILSSPLNPFAGFEITTLNIIGHNSLAMLVLISGSFLLGLTSFLSLILNGIFIGMMITALMQEVSLITLSLLILPHGIFELPALFIAGAAGFKIPYELIKYFRGKKDYILSKEEIMEFLILAGVAMVLIVIAGIIEANVTPRIAEMIVSQG
jgi:uncharacterized membrane protein SpoIIM required for sporulation